MATKIFAHRGASQYAPENTMPAFEKAIEMKADGIETDVQLTKDGIPVLIHDESLKRTTNGQGFVYEYTLDELKKLDAGEWFSAAYKDTPIITLEEFLTWVKPFPILINLELKNNIVDYKQLEHKVCKMVKEHRLEERTIVSSFNPESLKRVKAIHSGIETAFLTSQGIRNIIPFLHEIKADALHIKYRVLNYRLVKQCRNENIPVRVYTVNRAFRMARCYKLKCEGIFTDMPDVAYHKRLQNNF
ncbi:MAG: glycerophosphodiester phosphodiesterase [Bacillaceae bacterium]|nr:glycerophosphodiester phosphodiesterase [Bacillaceae bacterium]